MSIENKIKILISEIEKFEYQMESVDRIWNVLFPSKKNQWHYLRLIESYGIYYIFLREKDLPAIEWNNKNEMKLNYDFCRFSFQGTDESVKVTWNTILEAATRWLKIVEKDWIAANKKIFKSYPLPYRTGIVSHAITRLFLDDLYRIDQALGKTKMKKFIRLVESKHFSNEKKFVRKTMTAKDYFGYCKIAYLAAQENDEKIDKKAAGRALYERYADGRHEGLLDIDENSSSEFADWVDGTHPKRDRGGHPFEIKRGGNTTHIDLLVSRPRYSEKEGFILTIRGQSIRRLKESISMFLAIYEAGFPITITDPDGIRKRLLAQDNIGVVPRYNTLHRANQGFPEHQSVYDVLHFDDLGKYKNRLKPFITWEPLPVLKLREY